MAIAVASPEETDQRRGLGRARSAARGVSLPTTLPTAPAPGEGGAEPRAMRSALERGRLAAREQSGGIQGAAAKAAAGRVPALSALRAAGEAVGRGGDEMDQFYRFAWKGVMQFLWTSFLVTAETIILPIFLGPPILLLYGLRLYSSMRGKGNELKIPTFGILEVPIRRLDFPEEYVSAGIRCATVGFVLLGVMILIAIIVATTVALHELIGEVVDLLPSVL